MREVERQVMLRIIDQRWREHLEEMDYLKEGINLRAMGQKDPLTEWQREGYEMFGSMMKGIAQDFVRYVMHVQVVQQQAADAGAAGPGRGRAHRGVRSVRARHRPGDRRQHGAGCVVAPLGAAGERARQRRPEPAARRRRTTEQAPAFQRAAASAVAAGEAPAEILRSAVEHPHRPGRRQRPPGQPPRQAGDRRQGRVVEDAAQRAVPVRVGQEVQDVPRRR